LSIREVGVALRRYRGRHLRRRPKRRGPVVLATAAAVTVAAPAAKAGTHVIKRGETLSGIASRYGTSVTRLVRLNNLRSANFIVAGQNLRVPGGVRATSIHVVQRGQTLSSIAARYGTSVAALARVNRINDPNLIVEGTKLRVPRGAGGSPAHAPASASTSHVEANLTRLALSHGVSVPLVKAVAMQESGWQQHVVSSAGAIGVMQVMPATARFVNRSLGGGHLNIRDASENIHLGVMYLRYLLDRFGGSEQQALAGYYSGPGNVGGRLKGYQKPYVRNVLALKGRFS